MTRRISPTLFLAVAAPLLAVVAMAHLVQGRAEGVGTGEVLRVLGNWIGMGGEVSEPHEYMITSIRLPRLLVAIFAGASLSVAGAVMQAVFRNPLASPEIIGTTAGSSLGGALAIVLGVAAFSIYAVPLVSFIVALSVTLLVFSLAGAGGKFSVTSLLLAGIAMNTLVGSITAFVVTLSFGTYNASTDVVFWLMGGLDARTFQHVLITGGGLVLFGGALMPFLRDMDVLTLKEESAASLGLDVARVRQVLLLLACGLTAATVANTGGITFIGLVVPHMGRLLVGPSHRGLLPCVAVLGALVLVLSDYVCKLAPPDFNLRLGVVTSMLGAPFFLVLLVRHRQGKAL